MQPLLTLRPAVLNRTQHGGLLPYKVVYDGQPLSQTLGQAGFSPHSQVTSHSISRFPDLDSAGNHSSASWAERCVPCDVILLTILRILLGSLTEGIVQTSALH
jgi:hypothetical protein